MNGGKVFEIIVYQMHLDRLSNKHYCVLSNSGLSNATSKRPKFLEKRGNYCRDTAKIGIRTPLKSDIYFRFVIETIVE